MKTLSHTVFRFFQLLSWYTLISSEVRWDLRTDPVIFGGDVTLFCSLPRSFDVSFPRRWKTGIKDLTYDEGSTDRSKYEGSLEQNGFTLKIKQFRVDDFGRSYTCSYGFNDYRANLTTENYQWNPQPGTYEVDALKSTIESLKVKIRFYKVYPVPTCMGLIKDNSTQAKLDESPQVVDIYFRATSHAIEYQYGDSECGGNVSISCTLGNKSETIIINIPTPRQCADLCHRKSPCLNNGTCVYNSTTIECDCTDGFNGKRCENSDCTTGSNTEPEASSTTRLVAALVFIGLLLISVAVGYRFRKKLLSDLCQRKSPCLNNCTDAFSGKRCENSDGTTNQVLSTTGGIQPENSTTQSVEAEPMNPTSKPSETNGIRMQGPFDELLQ